MNILINFFLVETLAGIWSLSYNQTNDLARDVGSGPGSAPV